MDAEVKNSEIPAARTRFGWRAGYLLASFGLYMVDQATKAWAVRTRRHRDDLLSFPASSI